MIKNFFNNLPATAGFALDRNVNHPTASEVSPFRRPAGLGGQAPGITLVELLVVVLISVIVVAVAFTLFRVNVSYYVKEDARLEQDQNLRAAMASVSRDVRMAGNGFALLGPPNMLQFIQVWTPAHVLEELDDKGAFQTTSAPGWFRHADADPADLGARAIFGVDGESDFPDTLTVFRAEVESGTPLGYLSQDFTYSGESLELVSEFPEGALRCNDIVALVNGDRAVLAEVEPADTDLRGQPVNPSKFVKISYGGRFTPPAGTAFGFPAGAAVYNLRDVTFVTYYLAGTNLMADYHDLDLNSGQDGDGHPPGVVVASNIEDFQVFYFFNDDEITVAGGIQPEDFLGILSEGPDPPDYPYISSAALDVRQPGFKRVKAVALGLTARSPRPFKDAPRTPRPSLFNRVQGSEEDGWTRNVLIELINLRNF